MIRRKGRLGRRDRRRASTPKASARTTVRDGVRASSVQSGRRDGRSGTKTRCAPGCPAPIGSRLMGERHCHGPSVQQGDAGQRTLAHGAAIRTPAARLAGTGRLGQLVAGTDQLLSVLRIIVALHRAVGGSGANIGKRQDCEHEHAHYQPADNRPANPFQAYPLSTRLTGPGRHMLPSTMGRSRLCRATSARR